ncbi:MAG: citrate/2-methylcitrate synthase, partial [Phycisphaerales bacterium]
MSASTETKPAKTPAPKGAGLEGMVAGDSAICSVEQDDLIYRGYTIEDLATNATFEEVAHLLLVGHKPSTSELAAFKKQLVEQRALPKPVVDVIKISAAEKAAHPMDVLRSAVSVLAHFDPLCQDNSPEAELKKSISLTAKIGTMIGHIQNVIDGRDLI